MIDRSNTLLRYSAARTPSIRESGTAMAAARPARKNVLPTRCEISSEIGRPVASERPMSPVSMPLSHAK